MAYYDEYFPEYRQVETPLVVRSPRAAHSADAVNRRMLLILLLVVAMALMFAKLAPRHVARASGTTSGGAGGERLSTSTTTATDPAGQEAVTAGQAGSPVPVAAGSANLSPVFTREVQHWAPRIEGWATEFGLDPNLVAIIMQIESCGDQQALSHAGAQGLFQVMPFHFAAGEDALDPETNARRGLNYFVERLNQTGGDVGRAFAGYNGGHRAAASSWDSWPAETQRYYKWSTGIYNDIQAGLAESPTLDSWLKAGGASLCRQAAARIGLQ